MAKNPKVPVEEFGWSTQPEAAKLVRQLTQRCCDANPHIGELAARMRAETGTRLIDWLDHIGLPKGDDDAERLHPTGFTQKAEDGHSVWRHSGGLFPPIVIRSSHCLGLGIQVESIEAFLQAHAWTAPATGRPASGGSAPHADLPPAGSPLRELRVSCQDDVELWIVERHGCSGFAAAPTKQEQLDAAARCYEAFLARPRDLASDEQGFSETIPRIGQAVDQIGVDRACDRFFAAERVYWQSRNRAARVQKERQDRLGLGWANHDHHTYRSSRDCFARLIGALELLGFQCRERFYAGREAGWGAQVLEQPRAGIVIFADVDLSPAEIMGDFAHEQLPSRSELGTVGLWCKLHGESFLQAGMHHLECQFEFDEARRQLAAAGIETMDPFTDFAHLRQAFTEPEQWPVAEKRIAAALADGSIDEAQAEQFRKQGAVGSHLEILERNDGYKGFNQTGISDIIQRTDPRRRRGA